jgi:hypothetical protein
MENDAMKGLNQSPNESTDAIRGAKKNTHVKDENSSDFDQSSRNDDQNVSASAHDFSESSERPANAPGERDAVGVPPGRENRVEAERD